MLYSNVRKETLIYEIVGEGDLEVAAHFETGDRFGIYIAPGANWDKLPLEPAGGSIPYPSLFVWLNVTDPAGNTIHLEYAFGLSGGRLSLYNITTIFEESSQTSYVSIVNLKPLECKAETGGKYTAKIWSGIPSSEPPVAFQLRKLNVKVERPYSYLLPIGAVIFASGIVTLALSRFGPLKLTKKPLKRKLGSKSSKKKVVIIN
jgi:hypothetical protein